MIAYLHKFIDGCEELIVTLTKIIDSNPLFHWTPCVTPHLKPSKHSLSSPTSRTSLKVNYSKI